MLTIRSSNQAAQDTRSVVGPLRLPLEDPESFVALFNRVYARIGLSIHQETAMDNQTPDSQISAEALSKKTCVPCEGGVPMIERQAATAYLRLLAGWSMDDAGKTIFRTINAGNFMKAMTIMQQVAELAESEQHHPDLHLTGYRHLKIVLTTHAVGGLSENDFVLASKIDRLID